MIPIPRPMEIPPPLKPSPKLPMKQPPANTCTHRAVSKPHTAYILHIAAGNEEADITAYIRSGQSTTAESTKRPGSTTVGVSGEPTESLASRASATEKRSDADKYTALEACLPFLALGFPKRAVLDPARAPGAQSS